MCGGNVTCCQITLIPLVIITTILYYYHYHDYYYRHVYSPDIVSDIAIFVLKRDVKLQLTN